MDKYFTTEWGEKVSIIQHTLEQIQKWPNLKVYIGTDSQDYGPHSMYATVIVYRYGHRGAHFIFFVEDVNRIKVMYDRLFQEAVRTIEVADMLKAEIPIAIEALEFDYNHIKKFKSHPLIHAVKGWATGLGYNPVFKSGQMIAAKAGDHIVRDRPRYLKLAGLIK